MEAVLLDTADAVAQITINRPEAMNALNSAVWLELERALDEVAGRLDVHAAIISGAGDRAFSAGIDVKSIGQGDLGRIVPSERGWIALLSRIRSIVTKIEDLRVPVIAAIQGYCLGAGMELALACDIRLAGETARFSLPEVKLGVLPDTGGTQRLPRIVGLGKARELIYSSRLIDASEALRIGLVEHVYPLASLRAEAHRLAAEIAAHPPATVAAAKRATLATTYLSLDAGLRLEAEIAAAGMNLEVIVQHGQQLHKH